MTEWLSTFFSSENAVNILYTLLDLTVKGVLILGLTGIVTVVFRRMSAASRHLVWFLAICGLMCLPVLSLVLPSWHLPLLPAPQIVQDTARIDQVADPLVPLPENRDVPGEPEIPGEPASVPGKNIPSAPAVPLRAPEPISGTNPVPNYWSDSNTGPVLPDVEASEIMEPFVIGSKTESVFSGFSVEDLNIVLLRRITDTIQRITWPVWVLYIWIAGLLFGVFRYLLGTIVAWRVARNATPIRSTEWQDLAEEMGDRVFLNRYVKLLRSDRITSPMTYGLFRPVVLLPVGSDHWPEDRRRCVLMHEFAHVKRWDCLTQAVAQIGCAMYWINPLSWVGLRHLRFEREKACDDYVLNYGTKASIYATHLIDIARTVRMPFLSLIGAVAMAKPSQLEGRVVAILDSDRRRYTISKIALVLTTAMAMILVIPLAAMRSWAPASTLEETSVTVDHSGDTYHSSDTGTTKALLPFSRAEVPGIGYDFITEITDEHDLHEEAHVVRLLSEEEQIPGQPALSPAEIRDYSETDREKRGDTDRERQAHREERGPRMQADDGASDTRDGTETSENREDFTVETNVPLTESEPSISEDNLQTKQIDNINQETVRAFDALGFEDATVDQLVAAAVHEINPAYIQSVRSLGLDPTLDDLVQMRVFEIDEDYINEMASVGYSDLSVDELVQLRVHGIDKAYIESILETGIGGNDADDEN